ncbi:NAD-dependent protein deacetylase sirtuin-6 [Trichoplax sp. H2]|uniref:protein acetyllysine N-acetyltransferase n=1 Tax=Trichoplax adhaerens TaxID=10228 RepID=B3RR50_TRIAD|nr:hypothetical protein TRIADDRAFT_23343 [Trichoplax adhaerens]EDV26281.1 hypothetical protein TRIADDRAFT_23343 [Trichoplax adhaerens]RDD45173.1 NAD-dependent protein deacetylase sirtuin-6 [Trichoplax sp. H2]|eukprot:XP_002110277.1 hypothetical protein TRIADDRAFT_23343 [Trichoplax adhaerens]
MSVNYAENLSHYPNKGKCGQAEIFDSTEVLQSKIKQLAEMIKASKYIVVHTGAGISTSAGIPDFRGPRGVWTLEEKGKKPEINITFETAQPTLTHMAVVELARAGIVKYVISQNVDGLHWKSGLPRNKVSELHGNMFVDRCDRCYQEYCHAHASVTVGCKKTGTRCTRNDRCRGYIRDTILDWEDSLPEKDLLSAEDHLRRSDLSLCLGTSLQIKPSGDLPLLTLKNNGCIAICNLQPTKLDKKASLCIHGYVDQVMIGVMDELGLPIPKYSPMITENLLKRKFDCIKEERLVDGEPDNKKALTNHKRPSGC